jgi:hypothetical protein
MPREFLAPLLERWRHVTPEEARRFEDELREELSKGYALGGKAVRAVARRQDCDDVLFKVDGEEFCRRPSHLVADWSRRRSEARRRAHLLMVAPGPRLKPLCPA